MNSNVRDRLLLPVAVPLGIIAGIGVLVFSFSRILLAVQSSVAIAIALAAAVDVLVIGILVAGRKPDAPPLYIPLLAVSALAVVGGGLFAMRLGPAEHGPAEAAGGEGGAPAGFEITAENIKFDKQTIQLTAGGESVIVFRNEDKDVPHNVAVYKDQATAQAGGEAIFKGEVFPGIATKEYEFETPPVGVYYFHCDVHPNMAGNVEVQEGAAGSPAPGGGARESLRVSAENLKFDTSSIEVRAGEQTTIEFENLDRGIPHNIAIYENEAAAQSGGEAIFKGDLFPGVATREYQFEAPPPGTYYFHCDVHPPMNGTVTST